jgi:hypothetical protein
MAAGMISTSDIQLQFFPNQLLSAVFNRRIKTIDKKLQGNNKKPDGFFPDSVAI